MDFIKVIYGLSGIAQVGEVVDECYNGYVVKSISNCSNPPMMEIIKKYRMDFDYNAVDKVATSLVDIEDYYNHRINKRLEENRIDELRKNAGIELFNKYLK